MPGRARVYTTWLQIPPTQLVDHSYAAYTSVALNGSVISSLARPSRREGRAREETSKKEEGRLSW
jgi:hypothetical protein